MTTRTIERAFCWLCVAMAAGGLIALAVAITASPAEGGIFRPGHRYIFNWRRPAEDSGPDQDDARPIIDDRLSLPATTADDKVVAALVEENKKLKADAAAGSELAAEAMSKPTAAASAESKIPDWLLLAALGLGLGIPVVRRFTPWIP